eukprot:259402_1
MSFVFGFAISHRQVALFIAAYVLLLLTPISIYGNIKLYRLKNAQFMKKRSIGVVLGLNITFISMIIITALAPILFFYLPEGLNKLGLILAIFNLWFLFLFLNIRNWLIYFQTHWTHYTVQLEWQTHINPNIKQQKNWFIDNNNKYGNTAFITKRFLVFHFIGCILCIIGVFIRTNDGNPIIFIPMISGSFLISLLFYAIIFWKTPRFHSVHIFIHWESTLQSKLLSLFVLTFMCGQIVSVFISFEIGLIVFCQLTAVIFFMLNYVSTFALIRKNMDTKQKIPNAHHKIYDSITLNDILSNKNSVHLFMVYLTAEYSIECLLSVIELGQFEKFICELMKKHGTPTKLPTLQLEHVIKNSNIPTSDILENQERLQNFISESAASRSNSVIIELNEAKLKAHKLYNKYIRIGSEFEINLPSYMRKQIANILGDVSKLVQNKDLQLTDLLLVFKSAKDEMKKYLNYSYTRWKQQKEFQQVVVLFMDKPTVVTNQKEISIEVVFENENINE